MAQTDILIPVFVLITLTFVLLFRMAFARIGAIANKDTTMADIAIDSTAYPKPVLQAANAFHNQLQVPVLFYVLVAFTLILKQSDWIMVGLAWVFALSRLWHAYIHSTHNHVRSRFNAFAIGVVTLIIMWAYLAFKVFIA